MTSADSVAKLSLYERLGGRPILMAAVTQLYDRVLADERVSRFFVQVDVDRLERHLARFLTFALGGSNYYPGPSMRRAHQRLVDLYELDETHFDAMRGHLSDTLVSLSVEPASIREVLTVVDSLKHDVLCLDGFQPACEGGADLVG